MIKLFQLLKLCVVLLIGGHCNAQDYQWFGVMNSIKTVVWMNQYGIMNRGMLVMRSYNGINLTTLGVRVGCL